MLNCHCWLNMTSQFSRKGKNTDPIGHTWKWHMSLCLFHGRISSRSYTYLGESPERYRRGTGFQRTARCLSHKSMFSSQWKAGVVKPVLTKEWLLIKTLWMECVQMTQPKCPMAADLEHTHSLLKTCLELQQSTRNMIGEKGSVGLCHLLIGMLLRLERNW